MHPGNSKRGFTLIELLVVIAIIAILAVVVVLTLNPAQLLAQSRDANRVSDMATLQSALNLYVTDQAGASTFNLGVPSDTYPSLYDPNATSTNACPSLGLPSFSSSTGQQWLCTASSTYRRITNSGWIPVNFSNISAGSPISDLPVDPTNQTSTGLFYAYNTNGSQFQVTAELESTKYKAQYASSPDTNLFPDVISGGTQGISALYNPTGLVGYWPFDEGSGTIAIDQSGNGNNGTWNGNPVNGSHYTVGRVGPYAGNFYGTNDYVALPSGTELTGAQTFVLWLESGYTGRAQNAGIMGGGIAANGGFSITSQSGKLSFTQANSSVSSAFQIVTTPYDGVWTFIAFSWDGTTNAGSLAAYVNGNLVATSTGVAGPISWTGVTTSTLGVSSVGDAILSYIDDARIYSRALSPAEIMAIYNAEE